MSERHPTPEAVGPPPGPPAAPGCPALFLTAAPIGRAHAGCLGGVVAGAARRGERVLVLAPTPADADRLAVFLHAADRPAVRALAADEHPGDLPPALAART